MIRHITGLLLVITGSFTVVSAQNHVLFLGITEQGAPAYSRSFEQQLRAILDTMDAVKLMNHIETQRYREMTGFDRYTDVSQSMNGRPLKLLPDSVLIIWGTINSLEFRPIRKHLFGAAVSGELRAGISAYSPKKRSFLYNGTVASTVSVKKSPVFFSPVDKVTQLSAAERVTLTDSLIHLAVLSCSDVIRSVLENGGKISAETAAETDTQRNAPSISDVFTVPSVEAPRIERGGKTPEKNSLKPDSGNSPPSK